MARATVRLSLLVLLLLLLDIAGGQLSHTLTKHQRLQRLAALRKQRALLLAMITTRKRAVEHSETTVIGDTQAPTAEYICNEKDVNCAKPGTGFLLHHPNQPQAVHACTENAECGT